ncbi:MAG TPA: cell division protein FtsA [Xanthobacteraceae bacterium]|nr:cell division protein FtsA [Xanthobacteraceae bacterium]
MSDLAHGLAPKMKPISRKRSAIVVALDIGTSKIVCAIARLKPRPPQDMLPRRTHAVEVLGIGHAQAQGMKCGNVVDIAAAEEMLRHAVDQAERGAGVHVDSVVLSITAGRTASELFAATVHMKQPIVTDADIERVLAAGSHHSVRDGRAVLHSLPIGYALDDNRGVRDPRGMLGARLGVDMHVATTDVAVARNLTLLVERCHIGVEAMVAAPYVSGLAALAEDEADLGAAVVDMGAGTTTMAVFAEGRFTHVDGFTLGGQHVTMDIARGLTTTIADAERLKTLFGAALSGPSDDRDMVTLSAVDADPRDPPRLIPRAQLVRIIRPRVEEILEMVRDKLAISPFAADPRGRVILVGGASQLTGLADLATNILGRQVRIGRPLGIGGLTEATRGPAFTAAAGLLVYPQFAYLEHCEPRKARVLATGTDGYFTRVGRWLREGF